MSTKLTPKEKQILKAIQKNGYWNTSLSNWDVINILELIIVKLTTTPKRTKKRKAKKK